MRPYPPTGLTTQRWIDEVSVRWVDIYKLVFTQDEISLIKVLQSIQGHPNVAGDEYPHVVYWQDTYYLEDGHHRVAAHLLSRHTNIIEARLFEA